MKKLLILVLCFVMVLSMFAACGGEKASTGRDNVLTIGVLEHANCTDYENNALTKWIESQTGLDLEFVMFPSSGTDAASKLGTWIATGMEMPDIIWNMPLDTSVYKGYGEDGYFVDLAPYFNDKTKSAVFWERMEELPEESYNTVMRKLKDQETGAMYAFPTVQTTMIDSMDYQVYINQEWLDTLNLEMPTDPESLYNVLVAFRDKDPNGNGEADEVPMLGATTSLSGDIVNWLMNMFLYINDQTYFSVDANGKLVNPYTSDDYRKALQYINRLVENNLMPDSCWSMNYKDLKTILNTADSTARVGVWCGHPSLVLETGNMILEQYTAMPIWGKAVVKEIMPEMKTFITYDCDNVDAAWEVLMLMCSKEGSYRIMYGEKGVDWDDADAGTVSYMGLDAEVKVINNITTALGNEMWKTISATTLVYGEHELTQQPADSDPWLDAKQKLIKECYDQYQLGMANNPETLCPVLVYTVDEGEAIANERSNCQSYISQMSSKFCVGAEDINSDAVWTAYIKELQNLGMDKWMNQAQAVYDRQLTD